MSEEARCSATSKRSGERCKNPPMVGRTTCRMHGGKSPVGIASPNFKHGRKSKYLPARLLESYEAAASDEELARFSEEMRIVDAREAELIRRLDSGESGQTWTELQNLRKEYLKAKGGNGEDPDYYLQEILDLIMAGSDYQAWEEYHKTVDRRVRLSEAELKIMSAKKLLVPVDRMLMLFHALMTIVRDHVDDPDTLSQISRAATRLIHVPENGR